MIREGIQKLVEGVDLERGEATEIMREVMSGGATAAQIGALLAALRMKGETVDEITAFAATMRELCRRIRPRVAGRLVDTAGTGGDRVKSFNVSTAAAFVIAGAGIPVAKHGNRSVTSRCGSADVLEALGLDLGLEPEAVERVIEEVGIGFMFAPAFHPAMRYALGPRREIGIRTVFNILGPLSNPAGADAQLLGVYDGALVETLARVLGELGCAEAMVVHGLDGLDEVSVIGPTSIAWLRGGEITRLEIAPEDYGLRRASPEEIAGSTPKESAELMVRVLGGSTSAADARRSAVVLNAAAGIVVGGKAEDLGQGMELAAEAIESGAAYEKLRRMIEASGGDLAVLRALEGRHA